MNSTDEDIRAFEAARDRAQVAGDVETLRDMLADDLTFVHSTGEAHGKEAYLAHLARLGGLLAIERRTMDISRFGDVAIVSGVRLARMKRMDTGREAAIESFATAVLRREGGMWKLWLSQVTPLRAAG